MKTANKNTTQKTKKMSNTPHQIPEVNPSAREGLTVPASYKTSSSYSSSEDALDTIIHKHHKYGISPLASNWGSIFGFLYLLFNRGQF
jgi:cell division protein YceG involved in septum cleavage